MNLDNWNKLRDHIANLPNERVSMRDFWMRGTSFAYFPEIGDMVDTLTDDFFREDCGTAGCIAGYACFLSNFKSRNRYLIWDNAKDWLGIHNSEAEVLFEKVNWPSKIAGDYDQGNRKQAVLDMMDYFIKEYR